MIFQSYFTQVYGIPISIKISLKTISGRFKGGRRPPLSPTKKGKVVLNYSSKQCGSKGGGMHIYRKKSQKKFLPRSARRFSKLTPPFKIPASAPDYHRHHLLSSPCYKGRNKTNKHPLIFTAFSYTYYPKNEVIPT